MFSFTGTRKSFQGNCHFYGKQVTLISLSLSLWRCTLARARSIVPISPRMRCVDCLYLIAFVCAFVRCVLVRFRFLQGVNFFTQTKTITSNWNYDTSATAAQLAAGKGKIDLSMPLHK
jgi:hypothetical protein